MSLWLSILLSLGCILGIYWLMKRYWGQALGAATGIFAIVLGVVLSQWLISILNRLL